MNSQNAPYIPALRFRWLTPLYDPVLKWVMQEAAFKHRLIEQAGLQPGMRLLDLGCGTGTLTVQIKQLYPQVEVTGLDGDPQVLAIARQKADEAGVAIRWDTGLAFDLPYADRSFDRVVSSLMIHHLTPENKRRAFRDVQRVLQPGGEFHLVDFGRPRSQVTRIMAAVMKNLEETRDNFAGAIPVYLQDAGFHSVQETSQFTTLLGPLSLFRAEKPALNG